MANTNLANEKTAKNDEFHTQYQDIQKEINSYLDFDSKVLFIKMYKCPALITLFSFLFVTLQSNTHHSVKP